MADDTGSTLQSEELRTSAITEAVQHIPKQRKRPNNSDTVPQCSQRRKRGEFILGNLPVPTVEEEEDKLLYMTIREIGCRKSVKFGYDEKKKCTFSL